MQGRDIRFDKLKVIAMLGIVFIHCVANCDVLGKIEYLSISYFLISILQTICFSMTNVFVIVSSYLLINKYKKQVSSIRLKKVIGMVCLTTFYSISIYLILISLGLIEFSLFDFLKSLFSVFVNQYWFVGAYIFLYIVSPLLFRALDIFCEKELRILCIIALLFFSVFPTVFIFESTLEFYDAQHGKSIVWMLILFVLTFYFDKFGTKFIEKVKKSQVIVVSLVVVFILVVSRIVLRYVSYLIHLDGDGEGRLFFDESVLILIVSYGIFILALKSKQQNKANMFNNALSILSHTTLGIYLIHNNPHMRKVLWTVGESIIFSKPGTELILIIAIVLFVFILCSLLEFVRIAIMKKIVNLKLCRGRYDRTASR